MPEHCLFCRRPLSAEDNDDLICARCDELLAFGDNEDDDELRAEDERLEAEFLAERRAEARREHNRAMAAKRRHDATAPARRPGITRAAIAAPILRKRAAA